MSEDREKEDRWRALAEELGLPPEPASTKPAFKAAPPPPPPPPAPPPEIVEKPMPLFDAAPAWTPEPAESPLLPKTELDIDLPPITSLDPLDEPGMSAPFMEAPPTEQGAPVDDRPRGRGRGRGGPRGRRGRGGERSDESRSAPPPPRTESSGEGPVGEERPAAGSEEPRDDRRRRGGRGRRPPERRPEPEDSFVEEPDMEVEPLPVAADEDDGPEDNLADLNVPAWSDLIASLYRPER